jgi:hypothetical protein
VEATALLTANRDIVEALVEALIGVGTLSGGRVADVGDRWPPKLWRRWHSDWTRISAIGQAAAAIVGLYFQIRMTRKSTDLQALQYDFVRNADQCQYVLSRADMGEIANIVCLSFA